MAQATRITDVLEVQNQLSSVQGQIEQLTAQRSHLARSGGDGNAGGDVQRPCRRRSPRRRATGTCPPSSTGPSHSCSRSARASPSWASGSRVVALPVLFGVLLVVGLVYMLVRRFGPRPSARPGRGPAPDRESRRRWLIDPVVYRNAGRTLSTNSSMSSVSGKPAKTSWNSSMPRSAKPSGCSRSSRPVAGERWEPRCRAVSRPRPAPSRESAQERSERVASCGSRRSRARPLRSAPAAHSACAASWRASCGSRSTSRRTAPRHGAGTARRRHRS